MYIEWKNQYIILFGFNDYFQKWKVLKQQNDIVKKKFIIYYEIFIVCGKWYSMILIFDQD